MEDVGQILEEEAQALRFANEAAPVQDEDARLAASVAAVQRFDAEPTPEQAFDVLRLLHARDGRALAVVRRELAGDVRDDLSDCRRSGCGFARRWVVSLCVCVRERGPGKGSGVSIPTSVIRVFSFSFLFTFLIFIIFLYHFFLLIVFRFSFFCFWFSIFVLGFSIFEYHKY